MSTASPRAPRRPPARERLLEAADRLFYAEGIHTVGIDRVIEEAGVAKGSLFYNFAGKDELVAAYLERRHERRVARVQARFEGLTDPVDKLVAVFDALHDTVTQPGYRGCPFANASAEARPDSPEVRATARYRGWLRTLFVDLATEAGFADPEAIADRLRVLYDGAAASAQLDSHPAAALVAKDLARLVLAAGRP